MSRLKRQLKVLTVQKKKHQMRRFSGAWDPWYWCSNNTYTRRAIATDREYTTRLFFASYNLVVRISRKCAPFAVCRSVRIPWISCRFAIYHVPNSSIYWLTISPSLSTFIHNNAIDIYATANEWKDSKVAHKTTLNPNYFGLMTKFALVLQTGESSGQTDGLNTFPLASPSTICTSIHI